MTVPGGNLLNLALSAIKKQEMQYLAYAGRTVVSNGDYVAQYAAAKIVYGSIQPIHRTLYSQQGLDFQKNYCNIFVPQDVEDVRRASAGDQFIFNKKTFQVQSNEAWFQMDGWDQCLCVEVPAY